MSGIAYVNGRYVPIGSPAIAIEDRGYQFADGVYEVIKVVGGVPRDFERHMVRLRRSLDELGIPMPMSEAALALILRELLRRNGLADAMLYLQVSRGVAPRNHAWKEGLRPSLVATVRRLKFPAGRDVEEGVKVISTPDERWTHCHIKSISLLPNVMAKQKAAAVGAREAWLIDPDGMVTEGASSNAWIIDQQGRLITRPLGREILGGITRQVVIEAARKGGIPLIERPFSLDEAKAAREAFLTSTTQLVLPVTEIDGQPIGNGRPGSVTRELARLYAHATNLPATAR